ncbi:SDR family oxidoreductase, partial [Actinomadura sp. DSM 109109]|nr:SDR family oxidoreductase [Actinomadura lepetitiana]
MNAALLSFTKAMADAGVRDGVQVNAINPGAIRTERLTQRLQAVASLKGVDMAAAAESFVRDSHITRLGEPSDIAGLVAFITGPEGRFLQGSLIDMDGGQT